MLQDAYSKSWQFYKAQSEGFDEDFNYYFQFCKNHKTLDLFAGYGRLTNYLASREIDIESVEIEPEFSKFIKIPCSKKHIHDIRTFSSPHKFDRIIAGWNSFCLLTNENDIKNFFSLIDSLLTPEGRASLNYFNTSYWHDAPSGKLLLDGIEYQYEPSYDLSKSSVRLKDAPTYLGMDKNRFNSEVRPKLVEIPIGNQGIAFDRLDLDAWADHYKQRNGRPAQERRSAWDKNEHQVLSKDETFGTSINLSMESKFAKALELVGSKKPKNI